LRRQVTPKKHELEAQLTDGKATVITKDIKIDDEANDIVMSEAQIKEQWRIRKQMASYVASKGRN